MEQVNANPESSKPKSLVLEFPAGDSAVALSHFHAKLSFETDPSDVHADLQNGVTDFVIVDARSPENYARGHVPGAISFPHRQMNESTAAALPKDKLIVVYCDGIGCNASTKGAAKLSALGFRVKEMLGGIDWWRRDGYPVEVTAGGEAVSATIGHGAVTSSCGCG
jgi:rhodanese-related sulfurtransferase